MKILRINPLTRKRLRRFRAMRRAWWSFWILTVLYVISLGAELVCNNRPLYLRFEGRSYFPAFRFYPEDTFTGNGRMTRSDYKRLAADPDFRATPGNRMIFAPIPHGPNEIIDPASLDIPDRVTVVLKPIPRAASLTVDNDLIVRRAVAVQVFFESVKPVVGRSLDILLPVPDDLRDALRGRFANRKMPAITRSVKLGFEPGSPTVEISAPSFEPREPAPAAVRITLRDVGPSDGARAELHFLDGGSDPAPPVPALWERLDTDTRARLRQDAQRRFSVFIGDTSLTVGGQAYRVVFEKREIRWPHRPVGGHWMGIDGAGRDVLARVIYGLRTSMTFGLLLVGVSVALGTLIGALQGYFGGRLDLLAQRGTEIWSAIPFLYVMILLGSLFGRSFGLLLFCYGLFNWIGISYYMRAEFLRLRRQPFVEAARGLGLRDRALIFRHILPNALVPIITFTPFALVGAINALAALDFLGFGLPPPTASWGELIQQAQQFGWVWWLIVYPGLALFIVMLLGVFIGEGARNAFDPVPCQRLQ